MKGGIALLVGIALIGVVALIGTGAWAVLVGLSVIVYIACNTDGGGS